MVATTANAVKVLVIDGHTYPVPKWQAALQRARDEGVRVFHIGGEWQTTSVSHPGQRHTVNGRCDCEGAARGLLCKHLAAVLSARFRAGEMVQCSACGRVIPKAHAEGEWRHVGGQGDRLEWYCGRGHGHQAS